MLSRFVLSLIMSFVTRIRIFIKALKSDNCENMEVRKVKVLEWSPQTTRLGVISEDDDDNDDVFNST